MNIVKAETIVADIVYDTRQHLSEMNIFEEWHKHKRYVKAVIRHFTLVRLMEVFKEGILVTHEECLSEDYMLVAIHDALTQVGKILPNKILIVPNHKYKSFHESHVSSYKKPACRTCYSKLLRLVSKWETLMVSAELKTDVMRKYDIHKEICT